MPCRGKNGDAKKLFAKYPDCGILLARMNIIASTQQIQKQLLAPAMQQSIEMLLLPLTELNLCIDQELQNNPLLEIDEEKLKSVQMLSSEELLRMFDSSRQARNLPFSQNSIDDEILEEKPIRMETSLEDDLLQQLRIELSDPLDIRIGEMIIGSLNEDGYLNTTCEEIAHLLGIEDILRVEYILTVIQNFEPAGIASRNLKECLLSQVKQGCNGSSELIQEIIENHLKELGCKKFHEIARKLGAPLEEVKNAARLIALFEPKPARNYRPIKTCLYIKPDIFVKKDENDTYRIEINEDGIPPLRVSGYYQKMLRANNLGEKEKEFIREKIKNAIFFIKSIEQRGQTITRICEYILEKQKNFFEHGHAYLVPMTLKDIARSIDRNESTVSRAISNKYMDTPQGTFPLKFFFSQGVPGSDNGKVASRSIKEEIKELVESEDKSTPLSDQEILEHFKGKGTTIARRTISKYRKTLKILPSNLRKN